MAPPLTGATAGARPLLLQRHSVRRSGLRPLPSVRRFPKTIPSTLADCHSLSARSVKSSKAMMLRSSSVLRSSATTPMWRVPTYRLGRGFCTFPTIPRRPRARRSAIVRWVMRSCLWPPLPTCSASARRRRTGRGKRSRIAWRRTRRTRARCRTMAFSALRRFSTRSTKSGRRTRS